MAEKALNSNGAREREVSPWWEYIKAIVIALALALFIRTFVVQAFKIPSESMVDTLLVGDHLLVNKMITHFQTPRRGDIIVFRYPLDPRRDFVKRVIGLPGETIQIIHNKTYIDGVPLDEPYAKYRNGGFGTSFGPVTIPKGRLFMMGDNRDNSQDSRVWGTLNIDAVIGKAFIIHWSWRGGSYGVRWHRLGKLLK